MLRLPHAAGVPSAYTNALLWMDYFGIPFVATAPLPLRELSSDPLQLRPYGGGEALGVNLDLGALRSLPVGAYTLHALLWTNGGQVGTLEARTTALPSCPSPSSCAGPARRRRRSAPAGAACA